MPAVTCPHCSQPVELPADGRTYSCPFCRSPIVAPLALATAQTRDDAPEERPVVRKRERNRLSPAVILLGVALVTAGGAVALYLAVFRSKPADTASDTKPGDDPARKAAVDAALLSLGKVEGAVQAGTLYQRYTELVGDAKAAVNEAERVLPPSELKTALSDTIRAYADAGNVWEHKIRFSTLALSEEYGHGPIITRYKLTLKVKDEFGEMTKIASPDVALQLIWQVAAKKLAEARELHKR